VADPDQRGRRVKLTGARFADGRLPIDSLIELERYQHLLRVVARAEWEADHPGESVPDNFDDEVSLTIERIEAGSADVFLAFEQHTVYVEYQEQAQDSISETIAAAYEGRELPGLPALVEDRVREGIAELGATLEDGQSFDFYVDGADLPPVSITIDTRREAIVHLALDSFWLAPLEVPAAAQLETLPESLVGRITEVDADRSTYRFASLQYGTVLGHFKNYPELLADIRAVTDSEAAGPVLRVEGQLQYRQGQPWRFKTTDLVELFTAGDEPWAPRLVEFAQLASGWGDHGTGQAIAFAALDATKTILASLSEFDLPLPATFPTINGGILLEWASSDQIRSVEITPEIEFELFSMPTTSTTGSLRVVTQITAAIAFSRGEAS
jgi:nucleotide-binding universal stress UspA family protein